MDPIFTEKLFCFKQIRAIKLVLSNQVTYTLQVQCNIQMTSHLRYFLIMCKTKKFHGSSTCAIPYILLLQMQSNWLGCGDLMICHVAYCFDYPTIWAVNMIDFLCKNSNERFNLWHFLSAENVNFTKGLLCS